MSNPVPLVISGPPRSGTTLFSAMLDGHPDINWFPDEGYFFEHLHINRDDIDSFVRAALMGPEFLIEGIKDRGLMPPTDSPLSDFPSLKYNWDHDAFQRVISESRMIRSVKDLWELLRDAYLAGYGYGSRPYVSIKGLSHLPGWLYPPQRCAVPSMAVISDSNCSHLRRTTELAYVVAFANEGFRGPYLTEAVSKSSP